MDALAFLPVYTQSTGASGLKGWEKDVETHLSKIMFMVVVFSL